MPVAVVTGSNKGIGLAIVRSLCQKFPGDVYLTSRDEGRGQQAVETLRQEGLEPKYHHLDISKEETIVKLRDFMVEKYGGIDVLVNNVGIAFMDYNTHGFAVQVKLTMKTNYWDTKRTCELLFPVLRPGARVVNLSSALGHLGKLVEGMMRPDGAGGIQPGDKARAEELSATLASTELTFHQLDSLMKDFEDSAATGDYEAHGW